MTKKLETKSSETKRKASKELQKGSVVQIHRSQILEDTINPRIITEANAKRLKQSIKKNGLVGHLIWNKQTGHVVGGHQRLDAVDSLMRTKDYDIDVLMVDIPLKDEVRLNVVLNNADSQGVFDFARLGELSKEFDLSVGEDFGFSQEVIDIQFPEVNIVPTPADQPFLGDTEPVPYSSPAPVMASEEDIAKMKEMKKAGREALKEGKEEFGDFRKEAKGILTIVFQCETDKKEWLKSIGLPEDKMIANIEEIELPLVDELTNAILEGKYEYVDEEGNSVEFN